MSKTTFKVEKLTYYQNDKRELEDYTIYMNDKLLFDAYRPQIEELVSQLTLALNDRKEANDE